MISGERPFFTLKNSIGVSFELAWNSRVLKKFRKFLS